VKKKDRKRQKPKTPHRKEANGARSPVTWYVLGVLVLVGSAVAVALLTIRSTPRLRIDDILAAHREGTESGELVIREPLDGVVFPPEIVPPTFRWQDTAEAADGWVVTIDFADGEGRMSFVSDVPQWTPSDQDWDTIKRRSLERTAEVTILSVNRRRQGAILSAGHVAVRTSKDEVAAPIFYREVNLPFAEAVKDPAAHIRWRFGTISSKKRPPVVLEKLPVCGNCHSFSTDGTVMGMDVDYGNDKGSYAICPVAEEMVLDNDNIISWSDYQREDNKETLGFMSQISPDGRYAVSTVKDLSVFLPIDNLAFSQLFYPVQGILAYYDRRTETFHALPGADDRQFVQSNPTWSPDGKYIVYARSKAQQLETAHANRRGLFKPEEVPDSLREGRFTFDLYRIPFNDGKGGKPEPLSGASKNGVSNYFPRYSPDGKWIVFCRARNYMLLQPDSELYIIPAEGGEARRLACNTSRMNSWHSWSPNGKWLVFSSKANSPFTQLFLTHIDEQGYASPPVCLSQFTDRDRAANIPEFVNASPDAINRIREDFINDLHYLEAGRANHYDGNYNQAIREFEKALEINSSNGDVYEALGLTLIEQDKLDEAEKQLHTAIELDPELKWAHHGLGEILTRQHRFPEAVESFRRALQIAPEFVSAHVHLGSLLVDMGRVEEGREHLQEAARIDPNHPTAFRLLGISLLREGKLEQAEAMFRKTLERDPNCVAALLNLATLEVKASDAAFRNLEEAVELATRACELTNYKDPVALLTLSEALAATGRFTDAASLARTALRLVDGTENVALARAARERLELYDKQRTIRRDDSTEAVK